VPLREFRNRLVCDRCEGMLAPIADLAFAIEEITGVVPAFEYLHEAHGKRLCPECHAPMHTFKLRLTLDNEVAKATPELDRCGEHGIWFDQDELADVFAVARAKHPGGGGQHVTRGSAEVGKSWSGDAKGPFWWGGGHGNF
jgi:hypothetical protein